jgi:hypothetical protein
VKEFARPARNDPSDHPGGRLVHLRQAALRLISCLIPALAGCTTEIALGRDGGGGDDGGGDAACEADDCGAEALGAAPFRDGTRLHAITLRAESSVEVFEGWADSELGIDCRFGTTVDGVRRCVPTPYGAYYADAACTQAFVTLGTSTCRLAPRTA